MNKNTWSPDRIDSSKGYTKDNINLCLWDINQMKSNHTLEKFTSLCKLVVETTTIPVSSNTK